MLTAILIDDEERARRVLSNLIQLYCSEVEIIETCSNVPDGVLAINKLKPDVVFLDIEMPNYSGFELLGFFREVDFEIIFVTAYSKYAIKAFEVSAIDYLLKPVQIDLLENAVNRVKEKRLSGDMQKRLNALQSNLAKGDIQKIAIPVSDGLEFINVNDISHINADGAYSKVILINGEIKLVSRRLKHFEELLSEKGRFYRIHRSHLINVSRIQKYSRHQSNVILENNHVLNVARDNKSAFEQLLNQLHS